MSAQPASKRARVSPKPTLYEVLMSDAVSMLLQPPSLLRMRAALKVMTQHLRHNWSPDMPDIQYNARRSLRLVKDVLRGVVIAINTPRGVAMLNDTTRTQPMWVLYHFLRTRGADVEFIPPQQYLGRGGSKYPLLEASLQNRAGWPWDNRYARTIIGIRVLNDAALRERQVARTNAFKEELMRVCWRPDGPLMRAYAQNDGSGL